MNEQLLKTSGTDVLSSTKNSEKPYGGWHPPPPPCTSEGVNNAGDNGKTTPISSDFPSFYERPNETSSTVSMEVDGEKPVQNSSIIIENKEEHYDNSGECQMWTEESLPMTVVL